MRSRLETLSVMRVAVRLKQGHRLWNTDVVDLINQADEIHAKLGVRLCHSVACSNAYPIRKMVSS